MGRNEGKSEKATPRRRREARREGQIARSQEIGVAFSLIGALLTLRMAAPRGAETLSRQTIALFTHLDGDRLPVDLLRTGVQESLLALLAPFLAVSVGVALVGGAGQTGLTLATKAAKPKFSHLSPKRGLERLRPSMAGWELARSTVKMGLLAAMLWPLLTVSTTFLEGGRDLASGLSAVLDRTWTMLGRAVALAVVIAAADYAWNRRRTERQMRMRKEEVKREHKDQEGDPMVRAQRRRRASELSRNRMIRDVASADVIVTNPTHFAVALAYRDGDAAPRVVAKGADKVAARIRAAAHRHGVPMTEDKPLARTLYRRCKVGQFVPATLYEAVAIVLATAYRRRGRRIA